jgi:chemotaxis signal transduction protein
MGIDGRREGRNYRLLVHLRRRVTIVITPGGRVGYQKWRDAKSKRITVVYFDGDTPDNEVTIPEKLQGIRFVVIEAKDLFRREAEQMRRAKTARASAGGRRSGTRGAGGRAPAPAH